MLDIWEMMITIIVKLIGSECNRMKLLDFLAPTYNEVNYMLNDILPNELSNMKMLDLASGEGQHLRVFLEKNIDKIYAIDQDGERLRNILHRYSECQDKIEIVQDDILERKFQNTYDLVYLGDNSINFFKTHSSQYKVINVISSVLRSSGIGIINITPVMERNILDYSATYKPIGKEEQCTLYGKVKVDIFNQEIAYYYKDKTNIKKVSTRILLKKELEDMIEAAGLCIEKIASRLCKSGNTTYFYVVKLKQTTYI